MRSVSCELLRMAGPIDPDDQSESAVASGLYARDCVFYDNGPRWIHMQSPCRFEETIRGRLPCKMESFAFDAVNSRIEVVREASLLQDRCGVLAG